MDAVIELVWTGSYGRTTIDQICEKASVKKGSFYYFFASKTDLTVAAIEQSWEQVYRPLMDGIFSPSIDPLDRIKRHSEHSYEVQLEKFRQYGHVLGCPLFTLGSEISTQEQRLRNLIERILSTQIRYIESALREAGARNQIQCADPAFMARAVFLFSEGTLAEARIKNDPGILKGLWPSIQTLLGISSSPRSRSRAKAA